MTKCICGLEVTPANVHAHQVCGSALSYGERRDMITKEQEMQDIVEAVPGGCWHEVSDDRQIFENEIGKFLIRYCVNCKQSWDKCVNTNPSPTDLNAISEYEILIFGADNINSVTWSPIAKMVYLTVNHPNHSVDLTRFIGRADTEVDARRRALYAAIKENEK